MPAGPWMDTEARGQKMLYLAMPLRVPHGKRTGATSACQSLLETTLAVAGTWLASSGGGRRRPLSEPGRERHTGEVGHLHRRGARIVSSGTVAPRQSEGAVVHVDAGGPP